MNIQRKIKEIVENVESNITGRVGNKLRDQRYDNVELLLKYVYKAGGGNHLEIGTLFGGSAIPVALLKKEFDQDGLVYCVDPLDGYYRQYAPRDDCMDGCGVPVTLETLVENLKRFDVADRVRILQIKSEHIAFYGIRFCTAYIDGDHKGLAPGIDWRIVQGITDQFVLFDNYDDLHSDVVMACDTASEHENWKHLETSGITYVLKRVK